MFTGIVEAVARVRAFERTGAGARLVVPCPFDEVPRLGDSVAVSGCCLTVAAIEDDALVFELSAETLRLTWFGACEPDLPLNLERALRVGDRLGGHLVSGHVDGIGHVVSIDGERSGGFTYVFEVPSGFERYLIDKGSVTIDGISLTVVAPLERRFEVAVIPATFDNTTLGLAQPGRRVHLEADQVGKWIERLFPGR